MLTVALCDLAGDEKALLGTAESRNTGADYNATRASQTCLSPLRGTFSGEVNPFTRRSAAASLAQAIRQVRGEVVAETVEEVARESIEHGRRRVGRRIEL